MRHSLFPEQSSNRVVVLPSGPQTGAVVEFQLIGPTQEGTSSGNAGDVHNPAAMDSEEFVRIEPLVEVGESLRQNMLLWTTVEYDVVVGRLDPVDCIHRYELQTITLPHYQPFRPRTMLCLQEGLEFLHQNSLPIFRNALPGPYDGSP